MPNNCVDVNIPTTDNSNIPCEEYVDWGCVVINEDLSYLELLDGASIKEVVLALITEIQTKATRISSLETIFSNQVIPFKIGDSVTPITVGTGKYSFRMPYEFKLTKVKASLDVASSSGIPVFDINMNGTSILSTKLSIDATETTSKTAATEAVLSTTVLTDDSLITIDFDAAGTDTAGVTIYLIGYPTANPA